MTESSRFAGLGARLALAIGAVVVLAFAGTFVAVYRGTGARVHDQLRTNLETSAATVRGELAAEGTPTPAHAQTLAGEAIRAQPTFGPSSVLFLVEIPGHPPVTNEPELLGISPRRGPSDETPADRRREAGESAALLSADPGFSTTRLEDAGSVELYSTAIALSPHGTATVTVGSPLAPVAAAQDGVERAFFIAGGVALMLVLGAVLVATLRTTAPLREMERTAEAVDAGDPSLRMPERGARETRHLARSFNHMLDRIEGHVARQRQFVSDASHELRTPLTAIRGQAEVLGRAADPETVQETTGQISRQVARMDRLIDDMLLMARTDEDGPARVDAIDVHHLGEEVGVGLDETQRARVHVEDLPNGVLRGDHHQLLRALANIVQNAVEHTESGGRVNVSGSSRGGLLRLAVDDDGPGIAPAERELVFDRFHRSDASRDRRAGGSGLGLAIAQTIVTAHGGRVWADASLLGGARVVMELPGFEPAAP